MAWTEQDFYTNDVSPHLKQWGDHCRVENVAESGTPDISYAIDGIQGWIETKLIRHGRIHFEQFQPSWMRKRGKHTRWTNLWVLAATEDKKQLYLYRAEEVLKAPRTKYKDWLRVEISQIPSYAVHSPQRPWAWGQILLALVGDNNRLHQEEFRLES